MATHSSILAWRIPWTEEPDGLQSVGSQNLKQLSKSTIQKPGVIISVQEHELLCHADSFLAHCALSLPPFH